ncbi:MAG: hypothetical protein RJQ09_12465 [Cyclobacteriaceae bacterium]
MKKSTLIALTIAFLSSCGDEEAKPQVTLSATNICGAGGTTQYTGDVELTFFSTQNDFINRTSSVLTLTAKAGDPLDLSSLAEERNYWVLLEANNHTNWQDRESTNGNYFHNAEGSNSVGSIGGTMTIAETTYVGTYNLTSFNSDGVEVLNSGNFDCFQDNTLEITTGAEMILSEGSDVCSGGQQEQRYTWTVDQICGETEITQQGLNANESSFFETSSARELKYFNSNGGEVELTLQDVTGQLIVKLRYTKQ